MAAKKQNETSMVVKPCLDWLLSKGVFCWRNNTGAVPFKGRFLFFGKTGSADIIGIMPDGSGRFLAIECKMPGKAPNDAQVGWLMEVNENGGCAYVVESLDDLIEIAKSWEFEE